MRIIFFLVGLMMLAAGCSKEEKGLKTLDVKGSNITGKWKLTATYISLGGETSWQEVEDGVIYKFSSNGLFQISEGDCQFGTFQLNEDILQLNCDGDSQDDIREFYINKINYEELEMSFVGCIEACIYRFRKQ